MTLAIPVSEVPPIPAASALRRFTVDEYHRMLGAGILEEGEPIELLEGWLVRKTTRGSEHDAILHELQEAILGKLPAGWIVRAQGAITLADSEPEPDLAVARGPHSRYRRGHPQPGDIAAVIEAADASLERDREMEARVYVAAGIPRYWLVYLKDRVIEVNSDPASDARPPLYWATRIVRPGDPATLAIDGAEITIPGASGLLA